jgi:hypothetical protein
MEADVLILEGEPVRDYFVSQTRGGQIKIEEVVMIAEKFSI